MYGGDRSRKVSLVEHGFRLPSALDNRPLKDDEFEGMIHQTIYVSATPADYELEKRRRGGGAAHSPHGPTRPAHRSAPLQEPETTSSGNRKTLDMGIACWSPPSPSAWLRNSPGTSTGCASPAPTSTAM